MWALLGGSRMVARLPFFLAAAARASAPDTSALAATQTLTLASAPCAHLTGTTQSCVTPCAQSSGMTTSV